jgi:phospho-N-acetylmuramoyl-pentapeptide-transferase
VLYHLFVPLTKYLSGLNLFRYITFRTAGATITAILICLLLGPRFIAWLRKNQISENIREEGPATHKAKAGTPTMGGLIILAGIVVPTLLWANLTNFYILMTLFVTICLGALGYYDDYLKATKKERKGLVARKKFIGQVVLGVLFGLALLYLAPDQRYDGTTSIPFFKNYILRIGIFYIPWVVFVLSSSSNAVNLTDGLDGLAVGLIGICFVAFTGIVYVTGRLDYSTYLQIEYLPGTGELTVFCGAVLGSALGFLWFNSHPAEVFMGDTGSLALGGALGAIAIMMKKELLLVVVGGVFVATTLSVIIQVLSYRYRGGKRVFKMAPLHHHFELSGWPESKVVVRFWIVGALCALLTLATLKIR